MSCQFTAAENDRLRTRIVELNASLVREVEARHKAEAELASLRADKERLEAVFHDHEAFANALHSIGWRSPCDAQWDNLKLFLRAVAAIDDARAGKDGAK